MCEGCYYEYGAPKLITAEIARAADLVSQLYEIAPVGGNCHIVTDDWNLEDSDIEFCQRQVANGGWFDERTQTQYNNDPSQLAIEGELLELMRAMSLAERASALGLEAGYFKPL